MLPFVHVSAVHLVRSAPVFYICRAVSDCALPFCTDRKQKHFCSRLFLTAKHTEKTVKKTFHRSTTLQYISESAFIEGVKCPLLHTTGTIWDAPGVFKQNKKVLDVCFLCVIRATLCGYKFKYIHADFCSRAH